jgi:Fe-S cluster biogenesis protein NfuA
MTDSRVKITAEPSLDPDVCAFKLDRPVYSGRSVNCRRREAAAGAPLLEALVDVEGVREVYVSDDCITVARSGDENWRELGPRIGATIREVMQSARVPIPVDFQVQGRTDDELSRGVEEILATRINPAIAAHGGHVELDGIEDGAVHIRMSGGCQGCGAANITLKNGIEKTLRSVFPEIKAVVDVSDHAAGENPYYKPTADGSIKNVEHGGNLIGDEKT